MGKSGRDESRPYGFAGFAGFASAFFVSTGLSKSSIDFAMLLYL